jgi:aldehyde:ferredoxin oxidoreductase
MEGDTSLDYWVKAITERGLYMVRDDLLGVCKFAGLNIEAAAQSLKDEIGLQITKEELRAAVKRTFIRGLWLERKQGYTRDDYTMPAQVFDNPNPAIKAEPFVTREFFAALSDRVWEVFDREIASLPPLLRDEAVG